MRRSSHAVVPAGTPTSPPRATRAALAALALALLAPASAADAGPPPGASAGAPGQAQAQAVPTQATRLAALQAAVDAELAQSFLAKAAVSVEIVDLKTGKRLHARDPDRALNPASNVKLLTTAAALSLLGPEHRYPTRLRAAEVRAGVIEGDLYLECGGDPKLTTGDLYELTSRLRALGITKIKGGVVVDGGRFDADGLPPGFDQKQEFASYRAPIGACAVNFDTYELHVGPGTAGGPAHAAFDPPIASLVVDNQAKTVPGTASKLRVAVAAPDDKGRTTVTLTGTVGANARPTSYRYPIADPSRYAGEVLSLTLDRMGVKVGRKGVRSGATPGQASVLVTHRSDTLSVVARAINKLSNNFMAEMVLRGLDPAQGATAEASLERVRAWWRDAGLPEAELQYGNGSGLYDNNRLSAAQLVALLAHVQADYRIRSDFEASLSIAATDGTTRNRMGGPGTAGWVRAKTGTLDGVSALSGYVGRPGRPPVAFSILFNDMDRWAAGKARNTQDRIVEAIAAYLDEARPG